MLEIQTTERSGSFDAAFVKLGDWIENGTTHVDIADNLGEGRNSLYLTKTILSQPNKTAYLSTLSTKMVN